MEHAPLEPTGPKAWASGCPREPQPAWEAWLSCLKEPDHIQCAVFEKDPEFGKEKQRTESWSLSSLPRAGSQSPQVSKEQCCLLQQSDRLCPYPCGFHSLVPVLFIGNPMEQLFTPFLSLRQGPQASEGSTTVLVSCWVYYLPNLCTHHLGHWGQFLHLSELLLLLVKWIIDVYLTRWG